MSVAGAEPRDASSWDIGMLWTRLDLPDGRVVDGEMVRFGPRFPVGAHLYFGGEVDAGTLSAGQLTPGDVAARGGSTIPSEALTGTISALKALAGIQVSAGAVTAAAELAAGMHHIGLASSLGMEVVEVDPRSTLIEAHARVDAWLSPNVTLGAIANVDTLGHGAFSAGVMLGVHFRRH